MWDKIRKWVTASIAILIAAAIGIGYALRRRANVAQNAIVKAREQDAEARGRETAGRTRLQVIDGELAKPYTVPRRTAAQILEEQHRRGQIKE